MNRVACLFQHGLGQQGIYRIIFRQNHIERSFRLGSLDELAEFLDCAAYHLGVTRYQLPYNGDFSKRLQQVAGERLHQKLAQGAALLRLHHHPNLLEIARFPVLLRPFAKLGCKG